MSMETCTAIVIAEEFLTAKEFFDKIGFELIWTKDGNSENPEKTYCVRRKIKKIN
jgi:N-acetylglutamate synthase-like GNAT family acetyltransferase